VVVVVVVVEGLVTGERVVGPHQGNSLDHVMILLALETGPGGGELGGAIVALYVHGVVSNGCLTESFPALGSDLARDDRQGRSEHAQMLLHVSHVLQVQACNSNPLTDVAPDHGGVRKRRWLVLEDLGLLGAGVVGPQVLGHVAECRFVVIEVLLE